MTWRPGDKFTCIRGRTWQVQSVIRTDSVTTVLHARCVLSSRECPDAIGQLASFDAAAVTRQEARHA